MKTLKQKILSILAFVGLSATLPAMAFPIAAPGTEGFSVVAAGTGNVIATYEGNSAAYSNDLYLGGTFIFNNHVSPVGSTVDLGSFAAGTVLTFRLHVNNTGDDFYSGSAALNPDGLAHARVQTEWQPGITLVSFEDLFGAPEGMYGYNDLSFSFTNVTGVTPIPEPETYAMLMAGLGLLGAVARRRKPGAA